MKIFPVMALLLILAPAVWSQEKVSIKEIRESAQYAHNKKWLSSHPRSFISANIRGNALQYKERRQAALDIVQETNDRSALSEMLDSLKKRSFLSIQICELLGEWGDRRALDELNAVLKDKDASTDLKKAANTAVDEINESVKKAKEFKPAY